MENIIRKDEVFQKLEIMDKSNLDKVEGFVKCLILQRTTDRLTVRKRKPLLAIQKQDE